jgi:signal peptidase I
MRGFDEKSPCSLTPETSALFEDILHDGLHLRCKATGRSMSSFLRGGETLTIKKVPSQSLKRGDLIFFRDRRGSLILHRIIKKRVNDNMITFRTKGDAMIAFDEPVHENEVLGKVCEVEKMISKGKSKHIDMESNTWRRVNYLIALVNLFRTNTYLLVYRIFRGTR